MIIVSNTSPISNLAAIGKLDLLQQLYVNIIIPIAVYREIINSGETEPATLAIQNLDWIKTQSVTNKSLIKRSPGDRCLKAIAYDLKVYSFNNILVVIHFLF